LKNVNKRLARIIKQKDHFKCEMCEKTKMGKVYEYRNLSYVVGYVPRYYKQVCGDCIYRRVYGTKFYKKKKKEGSLDEMLAL